MPSLIYTASDVFCNNRPASVALQAKLLFPFRQRAGYLGTLARYLLLV